MFREIYRKHDLSDHKPKFLYTIEKSNLTNPKQSHIYKIAYYPARSFQLVIVGLNTRKAVAVDISMYKRNRLSLNDKV